MDQEIYQKSAAPDRSFKRSLTFKRVQGLFLKILPEFHDMTVEEIIRVAIEPIATSHGQAEKLMSEGIKNEIVLPSNVILQMDVRFFAMHKDKSPANDDYPARAVFIAHLESQFEESLSQVLLNRSHIYVNGEILAQVEKTSDERKKYINISEVVLIWIIHGAEENQQNRILIRECKLERLFGKKDFYVADAGDKGNPPPKEGRISNQTLKSLTHEYFVFVGKASEGNLKTVHPWLYHIDMLYGAESDVSVEERISALRAAGVIVDEEGEEMLADIHNSYNVYYEAARRGIEQATRSTRAACAEQVAGRMVEFFPERSRAWEMYRDCITVDENLTEETADQIFQNAWDSRSAAASAQ